MTYKPKHRLFRNYDKICPVCQKEFYSRNLLIKYCSEKCKEIGYKQIHKKNYNKYYQKNKEKVKIRNQLYYQENKEKIKIKNHEYYLKNKNKWKEYNKKSYQKIKNKKV